MPATNLSNLTQEERWELLLTFSAESNRGGDNLGGGTICGCCGVLAADNLSESPDNRGSDRLASRIQVSLWEKGKAVMRGGYTDALVIPDVTHDMLIEWKDV